MRAKAVAASQEARAYRKEISERMKHDGLKVEYVLDRVDTNDHIGRWKVKAFLLSIPGVGRGRMEDIMGALDLAADKRLRGLGPSQKEELRNLFP